MTFYKQLELMTKLLRIYPKLELYTKNLELKLNFYNFTILMKIGITE